MSPLGQLFGPSTQAIFYNWKQLPVQRMLDFDYLCGMGLGLAIDDGAIQSLQLGGFCVHPPSIHLVVIAAAQCECGISCTGRPTPSVACIVHPGASGFQKLFFGLEETAIPTYGRYWVNFCTCILKHQDPFLITPTVNINNSIPDAVASHPKADVFINFASFRSAYESSLEALKQDSIRVVAIIAEGVPEADAKKLIAFAKANNKVIIGPATVGGIQVRCAQGVPDVFLQMVSFWQTCVAHSHPLCMYIPPPTSIPYLYGCCPSGWCIQDW